MRILRSSILAGLLFLLASSGWWAHRVHAQDAAPTQPNVILISIDTLRADHTGFLGYKAHNTTPNLDRWAGQSVVFDNMHVHANETLFSHTAIMTSRYASELGALDFDTFRIPGTPTIAQALRQYNYQTAGFAAGGHVSHEFGFNNGFDTYEDEWNFGSFFHTMPPAMEWIEKHKDKPFFVFLHSYDCHTPYLKPMVFEHLYDPGYHGPMDKLIPIDFGTMRVYDKTFYDYPPGIAKAETGWLDARSLKEYADHDPDEPKKTVTFTPRDIDHLIAHYDGGLTYMDVWIGRFRAFLHQNALDHNTIVVVTSDHGEDLDQHHYIEHSGVLNDTVMHVPLFVWTPWLSSGKHVPDPARSIDIAPTILDLAHVPIPSRTMHGRSLAPLVVGAGTLAKADTAAFAEARAPQVAIRDWPWHLVLQHIPEKELKDPAGWTRIPRNPERMELYNDETDPGETKNLVGDASQKAVIDDLVARLIGWRQQIIANRLWIP